MNRLLIFCHYNPHNELSEYVLYMLKEIRKMFKRVIVVSNSVLNNEQVTQLKTWCDEVTQRPNHGFDFGAWKDAMLAEGFSTLATYNSITLMNDSCFGPLFDIGEMYAIMESKDVDFWGITGHKATRHGMPGTNRSIPYHIQSYFLVFNKTVVASLAFAQFWKKVKYHTDFYITVRRYETSLTKYFCKHGFRHGVLLGELADFLPICREGFIGILKQIKRTKSVLVYSKPQLVFYAFSFSHYPKL